MALTTLENRRTEERKHVLDMDNVGLKRLDRGTQVAGCLSIP